jgi:drug/metabolite transporter (DMT)-like permease
MYTFWLVLATLVWGTTFVIVKDTVSSVDEYFLVFVRNGLAAVPMFIYAFIKDRPNIFNKQALLQGAIMGFLLASTYIFQTIGLKFTSSGHSAFITGSAVVLVPFVLFFIYKENLFKFHLISIFIVFIGLFLLTYDLDTSINKGDLITFLCVAAYTFHIVLAGRFVRKTPVMPLIAHQFVFSTIFALIAFIFIGKPVTQLSSQSFGALLYLGLIGTLFCYFISVWAQKYVPSIKVALIFALEPVFAAIFAYITINEKLNIQETFGMILILAGIYFYTLADKKYSLQNAKIEEQ